MAHTFGMCLYHVVFSTADQRDSISVEWMPDLWAYMGGTARAREMTALTIGGTANHVHLLLLMPPSLSPSKGVQLIKANASRWINAQFAPHTPFVRQQGFGVFTVGFSQIEKTRMYIGNQQVHHRKVSFEDEYRQFLKKHMIEAKEEYLFG